MENRRVALLMDRSEYVKRCILKDMLAGGDMQVEAVPDELSRNATSVRRSAAQKRSRK